MTEFDGMTGAARIREWPRKGGLLRQSAKLVAAVDLVQAELHYMPKAEAPKAEGEKKTAPAGRKREGA